MLRRLLQEEMARGGFRTLVIAERELSVPEYEQWQERYAKASVSAAQHN